MPLFWFLAAALLVGATTVLVWPLLRTRRGATVQDADAAAIAVFRDQKRAVDEDFTSGVVTGAERDIVLADLAQRVAQEVGSPQSAPARDPITRRSWRVAVALLLAIPILAVVLYARLGDPNAATVATMIAAADGGSHELSEQQINAMIAGLAKRLEQHPDDPEGWALLARSNYSVGRFPAAVAAYEKAGAVTQDNADLLADYADALGMMQGRSLAGKPVALIERALTIDPRHGKALALAATAAMEEHKPDKAIAYWRRLAVQMPPDSDEARQVARVIAELGGTAPGAVDATQASKNPPNRPAAGTISGRVAMSSSLAQKVSPTDTVFIFARAPTGPRMPLAALRVPASELPKDFALDDTMGMAAGAKLSSASEVVVEARLSRTGNALPQPGDLFGKSAPVKPGATGLRITIDQVVP